MEDPNNNPNTDPARDGTKPDSEKPMNDKMENVIRDPVLWNGQTVSYIMDIGTQDPEYDANVRKVKIGHPGGATQVVPESEIMRDGAPGVPKAAQTLNRPNPMPESDLEKGPKVT